MANFAVIHNDVVVNVIVADTIDIAEKVTKLTCVNIENLNACIGDTYIDGQFIKPIEEEE